jgi:hypothetical protein
MLTLVITAFAASALAAPAAPCVLPRDLLATYDNAETVSPAGFGRLRLQVETFMTNCPAGPTDAASRAAFFDLLAREYTTDWSAQLRRATTPDEANARWEAINTFQTDLSTYLDRIVQRSDVTYKATIFRFGSGRAIAALGPAVKSDVVAAATSAGKLSGLEHRHNAQEAAFEAIGYWIDPSNRDIDPRDKAQLTSLLVGAIDAADGVVHGGMHQAVMVTLARAAGHSDDPRTAASLRRFAERLQHKSGEVYQTATKSADAVEARAHRHDG